MTGRRVREDMERLRGTVRARSATTGRWVRLRYALRHPATTVLELIRR